MRGMAALWAALLVLGGCERTVRDMYEQPRYDPGEPSSLWPDGKAMRAPVPGTVPFSSGDLAATSATYRFSAAVAGFGQLLRDNHALGAFDYDDVLALAAGAREDDAFGYRAEFITRVKTAQALSGN